MRKSAIAFVFLLPVRPASGLSEVQATQAREVVLDREWQEIERKQLQERLENWNRAVLRTKDVPPPGDPTVDVEDLRIPQKARKERDAAWRELQKNKLESAERKATKALAIFPDYWGAYLVRGEIRLRSGHKEAAEADFQNAIAAKPDASQIPGAIAAIYLRSGLPDMALWHIRNAILSFGESSESLCFKGEVEFMLKRFDEAELSFRRSLAIDPGNHLSIFYIARICSASERYDETIQLLRPLLNQKNLKVEKLQVVALIEHAERLRSRQTQAPKQ